MNSPVRPNTPLRVAANQSPYCGTYFRQIPKFAISRKSELRTPEARIKSDVSMAENTLPGGNSASSSISFSLRRHLIEHPQRGRDIFGPDLKV
jgi:hypothetical protein